ncbi:MAG: methylenetetrahydrofolate reductase [Acidobacteria bacterium]|nr:methylenetetrahydrofolate reductase [Acidobacteriota bacterium]
MARIGDLLHAGPTLSFEFGPPRTDEQARRLEKVLHELQPLHPSFVSVTYGAGGTTRQATREIVEHIHRDTDMTVMPHLTCVAQRHGDIHGLLHGYADAGIENVLALAGDAPNDGQAHESDFTYAVELIEMAREVSDFSIGVSAFPEGHPRSPDLDSDRFHLAAKLALADFGITQFFFDTAPYFRMRDQLAALGVDKPVLPGVMMFSNVEGVRRMSALNNTTIPEWLQARLDAVDGNPGDVRRLAVELAADLIEELLAGDAPGVHLYTMNFSRATREVVAQLGLR